MFLGIALSIASIIGIVNGIVKKNKLLVIGSVILQALVIVVWVYFYNNPY